MHVNTGTNLKPAYSDNIRHVATLKLVKHL